ncbi:hypothetical protein [Nocardioides lianchengensis]|uniref:Uncharacterized protein n=1 Tax=Nocardioides lianchengensis TaxID=1045774 RepID=A0A1G6LUD7_9ACTN|nr:hypothetical protein [Nocardioides lianchengensis]NYG12440.1 hypothetical protein [Nocardioides lianchengensis]SDC46918.1 hypothetical protein SAMN05421872_102364 [Nocardioides lianchengensis]
MPRTFLDGLAAIRRMAADRVDIGAGNCKLRTREAFAVPSNGTPGASASWAAAPDQHPSSNPLDAPPLSFGWMTGGGQGHGHVVVVDEQGDIWTPGGPTDDDAWYETTAARLLDRWPNLRWVGWTRSIDGQYPALPTVAAPAKPASQTNRYGAIAAAIKALKVARGVAAAQGDTADRKRIGRRIIALRKDYRELRRRA